MPLQRRYLEAHIRGDLDRRMVFVGGPRQVGKTTLARLVGEGFRETTYRNWDHRPHRQALLDGHWPPGVDLLILDEIHKWPRWKGLVKGLWDTRPSGERIIVTGSSRLDIFRRGGDSLLGRYRYYRLHPFSLAELNDPGAPAAPFPTGPPTLDLDRDGRHLETLFTFGGFPEPCLSGRQRTLRRWQKERFERVFREDIRETEAVRSLAQVELLGSLLPGRVGSPLSSSSLAEDVEASPKTVRSWIELLARNYYLFRVPPWHRRLERALKKESKYYLWDWSEVKDEGPRFENMVAAHLLKLCHYYEDTHGIDAALYYVRDQQKREVDFLVVWEGEPWFLVECKAGAPGGLRHLRYFGGKLEVEQRYCVTPSDQHDYLDLNTGVRVVPARRFLMALV